MQENSHSISSSDWEEWRPCWPWTNSCSTSPSSSVCTRLGFLPFRRFFRNKITFHIDSLQNTCILQPPFNICTSDKKKKTSKRNKINTISKSSQNDIQGYVQNIKLFPFCHCYETLSQLLDHDDQTTSATSTVWQTLSLLISYWSY